MYDIGLVVQPPPTFDLEVQPPNQFNLVLQNSSGPAGVGGEKLQHTQSTASDTWVVNHNFGWKPNVQVLSTGGREMLAEILHTSDNQVQIFFDEPRAGLAICS